MNTLLSNEDKEILKVTADIQDDTKNALTRIQRNLAETEDTGTTTLEELYAQRDKLERIDKEGDRLHEELDEANHLMNKFGSCFGKKKKHKKKKNDKKNSQEEEINNKSQKKKWSLRRKSKKKGPIEKEEQGLLGSEQHQHQELKQLVEGDEEIEDQIDEIGNQLDNLLQMTQEMGKETNYQGQRLGGDINESLSEAQHRQKKANKKIQKYISK
mmetsp:Transcript_37248/g.42530  ORF Transcript_37248/g.42530 Transcript_37248/m.42530 type:complete len:214 (+) Transcript_37248:113-754(+)